MSPPVSMKVFPGLQGQDTKVSLPHPPKPLSSLPPEEAEQFSRFVQLGHWKPLTVGESAPGAKDTDVISTGEDPFPSFPGILLKN